MVFTNEKCVGCNKCIRSCPVLSANVAEAGNINVDEKMCIQCGTCFDNCMHEARDYDDDTKIFLMDLKAGKKYAVIVAPAFCTFRINGAPFPRQRCKRLAPAVRYPFVVTC